MIKFILTTDFPKWYFSPSAMYLADFVDLNTGLVVSCTLPCIGNFICD